MCAGNFILQILPHECSNFGSTFKIIYVNVNNKKIHFPPKLLWFLFDPYL